jgi:hypothetical protein
MTVPDAALERLCRAGNSAASVGREIACELMLAARAAGRVRGVVLSSASGSARELVDLLRVARTA